MAAGLKAAQGAPSGAAVRVVRALDPKNAKTQNLLCVLRVEKLKALRGAPQPGIQIQTSHTTNQPGAPMYI
jgi:hypothetical protein